MARGRPEGSGELEGVDLLHTAQDAPIVGPVHSGTAPALAGLPRLARHRISLADGHQVGIAVCGRGVPIVLVHGFTAEGVLYAQTLSRLVSAGYKVVAIDTAGHGSTQGLPTGGATLSAYSRLLGRVVDELGIRQAVFAGHSMGGRIVTELCASDPSRALAVILLDAIVGEPWDRLVNLSRFNPLVLAGIGAILLADSVSTAPMLKDPRQAVKLGRLVRPMLMRQAINPLRMVGPGVSILRSRSSKWMLEKLGREGVPVLVIHGDRDIVVPVSTARSAAKLTGGRLVVVEGGRHSWLLKDPEAFPAILREAMASPFGRRGRAQAFAMAGLDPETATLDDIEAVLYEPDAPILALTPPVDPDAVAAPPRPARYRWHVEDPS
ncbi:MAG: putative hydrolase or acyltransferase of alpha/beta superfamily [Acidimicrobiales bacterium]|nr:putative hydrolase or acyltransferase of alpha/beta superfamily [Acidimicrobiales bacterium]